MSIRVCVCVCVQLPPLDSGAVERVARAPAITSIEKTMAMHSEWELTMKHCTCSVCSLHIPV